MTQVYSVMGRRAQFERLIAGNGNLHVSGVEPRKLTSKEKGVARKMARNIGCTIADIAGALSWKLSHESLRRKLAAINIYCVGGSGKLSKHLHHRETAR